MNTISAVPSIPPSLIKLANDGSSETGLHLIVERHAVMTPDKTAVCFGDDIWSYRDLDDRANQLVHGLRQENVDHGGRVVVCSAPNIQVPAALLAVQKLGAVYVPIGFDYPRARIQTILEELQPEIALTTGSTTALFQGLPIQVRDLEALGQNMPLREPSPPSPQAKPDDIAYIFYTSGTTGAPKGIAVSYRGLAFYVMAAIRAYGIKAADIMPSIAKYSFSISLFELMCPIVAGGSLVLLERDRIMNAASLAAALEHVTIVHIGPSLFSKTITFIKNHYGSFEQFEGLRHVSVGGDVAQPDLLEDLKRVFKNAEVYVIYGCTEIACMGCTYLVPRDRTVDKTYVGKAFAGMEVLLLGEDGKMVLPGEKGEVAFAGAGLLSEYIDKPDLTREKLITIGDKTYFRTGDVGRLSDSDDLELLGRRDFQIKLRGMRIEPVEIETLLRQAPGVQEAIVSAPEMANQEKRLVGYIVPEDQGQVSVRNVRGFLTTHLPDYMIPSAFVLLDRMPLNQNLKVDRRALPLPTADKLLSDGGMIAPRNDIEKRLVEIWCVELGLDEVGVTNSFFDVGGDSLLAINVLMEVENAWGVALSNDVFLETPTIEGMARIINGDVEIAQRDDIVPLREGQGGPPIFCLFGILTYRDFAAHLSIDRSVLCVAPRVEDDVFFQDNIETVKAIFPNFDDVADRYLAVVRKWQPSGPYTLAGHSWGGVVALEAAKKLVALGDLVDLVILFDANEPSFYRNAFRTRHWRRRLHTPVSTAIRVMRNLVQPKRSVENRKHAPNSFRRQAKWHSSANYQPTPYEGRVILFKAEELREFAPDDPKLGWEDSLPEMEVYKVPGNHFSMLRAPNVQVMTRYLNEMIGPEHCHADHHAL